MQSNKHELRTAIFEDGTHVVLRADQTNPRLLEVIATFYEATHARDYVQHRAAPSEKAQEEKPHIAKRAAPAKRKKAAAVKPAKASGAAAHPLPEPALRQPAEAKPKRAAEVKAKPARQAKGQTAPSELSERQASVLKALRSLKDKKNRVEAKVAELAKASSVPLGSLHSILVSLEKKQMIRTERQGSPKFAAIYEVLEAPRKSARSLNGVVHSKAAHAEAAR
jgi:DNA-binding MarR family transcriptional regulator